MSTFIYSPGIQVLISTDNNGIVDISEDITSGSLTLTENRPSSLNVSFLNHRRKYDGLFTPNDIIVVRLKRLAWMPVFAGYLDSVPYFSVYPRGVTLKATDTLKRLKMAVWDQGSSAAYKLLSESSAGNVDQVDGGLRDKIIAIMTQVANWPASQVHIGNIPSDWADKLRPLHAKLAAQINVDPSYLGTSGVVNGTNTATYGTISVAGIGEGTGTIPHSSGRVGLFPSSKVFEMTNPERSGPGQAGAANGPKDEWYIGMRFPYREDIASAVPGRELILPSTGIAARKWWKGRKILVMNPKNNKAIVVRAVDWGPSDTTGKIALLSRYALQTGLGAKDGDQLEYRFASDTASLGSVAGAGVLPGVTVTGSQGPSSSLSGQAASDPTYVSYSSSGQAWTGADGLQPHVQAARVHVKANWNTGFSIGGKVVRNIAGTNNASDHATGHAIDVNLVTLGKIATGDKLSLGNAIAQWFVANPQVFNTKYVIWMDRINSGNGWRKYEHPSGNLKDNTLQHRDHVHLSFKATGSTQAGPMGSSWPGSSNSDFNNLVSTSNGVPVAAGGPGGGNLTGLIGPNGLPLLNAFQWTHVVDPYSEALAGPRALLNDKPLLPTIQQLCNSSQRSFMAAPNGDFMAWFPDYFGQYGTASKMIVRDIEIAGDGFTIGWDDDALITHQFTAGAYTGFGTALLPGGLIDETNKLNTMGIATVEFPELMEALFNVGPGSARAKYFRDPEAILQRFGARVDYQSIPIISGPQAEFWYACHLFMKSWASQFSAKVGLAFMPELWPGMLLQLESYKFQAYVEQVTHSWTMGEGGGFETSVQIIAPSTTDRSGFFALPLGGEASEQPVEIGGGGGKGLQPL